jgi:micrococcal nuclease
MTKIRKARRATTPKITNRFDLDKLMLKEYRKYSPRRRFSGLQLLIVLLFVIFSIYIGNSIGKESVSKTTAKVVSVSDGDTIKVEFANGTQESIRLIGVDTPETHHPTKPVGCFGVEAENFTRKNLENRDISLEYDVERKDKYDRTLAYVYLGDVRFNDVLLQQGYAKVLSIEPNTRYANMYSKYEVDARNKQLGLWGYCSNDN